MIAFAVVVVLGGANSVAIRFSNFELPPYWGATLRFGFAILILWTIVAARRIPLPRGRSLLGTILYGVLTYGGGFALFYRGLVDVGAGVGQVIAALVPLMTFFFALAHGQEQFRLRGLVGSVIAAGGIALAFSEQMSTNIPLAPLLGMVAGAACGAEGSVILKQYPMSHPFATNAVGMTAGIPILMAASLAANERWIVPERAATWTALGYMVLVGSVVVLGLVLFVLSRWTASGSSYQFVLMPFVTVALAAWLAAETVSPIFALGGSLVLTGVWVGALQGNKQQ
jgi:drug/metabolite transporter (DMT)-like permease